MLLALIYNQPRIALDGNVKRVLSRLSNINMDNALNLFKTKRNADLAEALIEFGALICKPKDPRCNECKIKKIARNRRLHSEYTFSPNLQSSTCCI